MFCVPTGKKNYQFEVTLGLEELSSVPFVNGILFAKMRLVDYRNSKQYSSREPIKNHVVTWNSKHKFQSRLVANVQTNMLEPSEIKISVRKEIKGGKSYLKMGYVLVNIACFANLGDTACRRRYILEGYNQDKRQDNSMLQMHFTVCQLFGDPCFRVPIEDTSKCVPYEVLSSTKLLISTPNSSLEGIDGLLDSEPVDSEGNVASFLLDLDQQCGSTGSFVKVGSNTITDPVTDIYNEISRHNQNRNQEISPVYFNQTTNDWDAPSGEPLIATIPKFSKQTPLTQNPGYSTCPHPMSHSKISSVSTSQSSKFQPIQLDYNTTKSDMDPRRHRRFGSSTQGSVSTAAKTTSSGYVSHSRHSSNESTSCTASRSPQNWISTSLDRCEEQYINKFPLNATQSRDNFSSSEIEGNIPLIRKIENDKTLAN